MDIKKYTQMIDHTKLSANASKQEIIELCNEAKEFQFFSVCINPYYIDLAKKELSGSNVKVCTVIGFPLGQNTTESKIFETVDAIQKGADEVDMVINIAKLKEGDIDYCVNEINLIKKACKDKILKVIVETCLLTEEEKVRACNVILKSDADFIKTSTGFSTGGATFEDIKLFKENVKNDKLIKAAGGIKTGSDLIKMVDLGANRIGTSRGVSLINDLLNGEDSKNSADGGY